jgi:hypothetical protein
LVVVLEEPGLVLALEGPARVILRRRLDLLLCRSTWTRESAQLTVLRRTILDRHTLAP